MTLLRSEEQGSTLCAFLLGVSRQCWQHCVAVAHLKVDWAFKKFNDPYISGAATYLDKGIGWAQDQGLKVIVDLHGAPGSQNGFDNSGQRILTPGTPKWTTGDTVQHTLAVLQLIANKYAQPQYQQTVVAIELLNEPLASKLSGGTNAVVQYYNDAYGDVRVVSDTPVVLHDAFQNGTFWNNVLTSPGSTNGNSPTIVIPVLCHADTFTSPSDYRYPSISSVQHARATTNARRTSSICV